MTQFTDRAALQPGSDQPVRRAPEAFAAMLGGAVAACLGFGLLAVVVLFMWITSPYPDSGPEAALRVAGALWLLAHGADLVRPDAITGAAVPVGVTPLLLVLLPGWLVHRAAAHTITRDEDDEPVDGGPEAGRIRALGPFATTGWLLGGYLLVALAVLVYARHGALHGATGSALLNVPLLAVPAAVCGIRSAGGWHTVRPSAAVRQVLDRLALPRGGAAAACRAAALGTAVLFGGGMLLAGAATAWHAGATGHALTGLTTSLSGRLAVLLLTVALLPNAAMWAVAYALGTGFAVGTAASVTPAGVHGHLPVLPHLPLLASLPGPAGYAGGPVADRLLLALPVLAGAALAVRAAGIAVERGWSAVRATVVVLLAAVLLGGAVAVAAAFAGGPMGVGTLASFGPDGPRTGYVAACWAAAVGVPVVLVARWWRGRRSAAVPAPAGVLRTPGGPEGLEASGGLEGSGGPGEVRPVAAVTGSGPADAQF